MKKKSAFPFPALLAVLTAIVSVQGGAALAKGLFPVLGPVGTVTLRIGFAAIGMLLLFRPPLRRLKPAQWRAVAPYGLALGLLNLFFYASMARLPLGLAVAVGFVGPLGVALVGARRWYEVGWIVLAALGLALIMPWRGQGLDLLGLGLAVAGGVCWAGYIVLGQRTAGLLSGPHSVAVGLLVAALPVVPAGLAGGQLPLLTWPLVGIGVLMALASSVVPLTLEMYALHTLPTRTFSILMSLEPVVAALLGWGLLHEHLTTSQWVAIGCIVFASAGATLTARHPAPIVGGE